MEVTRLAKQLRMSKTLRSPPLVSTLCRLNRMHAYLGSDLYVLISSCSQRLGKVYAIFVRGASPPNSSYVGEKKSNGKDDEKIVGA